MTRPSRHLRIGLLWHSVTSDNLGVGALTLAHVAIVAEAARAAGVEVRFIVLGWTDRNPEQLARADLEVVGLRMKDFVVPFGGLYRRLRHCDLVLDIGAGDSFADIYGMKRFWTMLGSKILTILARRPLILAPQTVGPFDRRWTRSLALAVLNRATAVATRDDLSTAFLREIGYSGDIVEASDVALRLPYDRPTGPAGGKVRVGLNVSGLLFNGGYTRDNMFGLRSPYAETIRGILRRMAVREDIEMHLVPHVISDAIAVEDDHRVNRKLAEEFPGIVLAPRFGDPIEAKSYISGLDFFAGARMHACIAAFSSGVPVLPMAYSRKFAGLFGSTGYPELADCKVDTTEEIVAKFESALERREALRVVTQESLARGLDRLGRYETVVAKALRAAVEPHAR